MEQKKLTYFDFKSGQMCEEKVPAEGLLRLLYENDSYTSFTLKHFLCKTSFFSKLMGFLMRRGYSKRSIPEFVRNHNIDMTEYEDVAYKCFNDFFIRKLAENSRKISPDFIISPCDGRHLFFQKNHKIPGIYVKGETFTLESLLKKSHFANLYKKGSMMISRLAPVDYHRFHMPCDAKVEKIININGHLHSVSPIALKQRLKNITENKRMMIVLSTKHHGNILMIPVGATSVGSILITAKEGRKYKKGDELGYFSFGGSMVITLFQKDTITFNLELTKHTNDHREVFLKMGASLTSDE